MQNLSEDVRCNRVEAAQPAISVVVIGRNEGPRLARCLDSIAELHGVVTREFIYVDSASTDGSPELASRYGATSVTINPARPTAAMGRNTGWRRTTSDLILFLDGDTVLDRDFPLAACEALLNDDSVAAVWGHRREMHPDQSLFNRVLDLDWIYTPGFTEFCGGDVLMRRKALVETGGFDEGLIAGEEPELCRRMRALGYRILHIDRAMTGHDLQITRWSQYWKRAVRAGHAYAEVSERFRSSDDSFWSYDRTKNLVRGSFWGISFAAVLVTSMLFGLLPITLWIALLLLLSLRSAWKARWKARNRLTLFLYGIHSQLQHLPILVGQLSYELGRTRSKKPRLIEYKSN
jgi:GT2 family glycosyltransferase